MDGSCVIVVNNADGKKYKMMLKGDMSLLTIGKVKRYLQTATGADPSTQMIRFNNQAVSDGMTGSELGLYDGAVMFLDVVGGYAPQQQAGGYGAAPVSSSTPYRGGQQPAGLGAASPVVDIERIRMEERQKLETERRLKELQDLESQRQAERVREEERERARELQRHEEQRLQQAEADAQRIRDQERLVAREHEMERDRRELEQRAAVIEDAKNRDIEELRAQQQQLSVERRRFEMDRSAPNPQDEVIRQQQAEIERLRNEKMYGRPTAEENVRLSLSALARELHIPPLELDVNQTCAVTLDDGKFNVLLTYDPATQRLYMYATILNSLPADPNTKLQLYELLLEGALLGRDMAGGGVGISTKNNVVLLSSSLDMAYSDQEGLANLAKPFLEALRKWNSAIETILVGDNPHHRRVPTLTSANSNGAPHNALTGSHSSRQGSPIGHSSSPVPVTQQQPGFYQQPQQDSYAAPSPSSAAAPAPTANSSYAARHTASQQYAAPSQVQQQYQPQQQRF